MHAYSNACAMLNKLPQVTLFFWIVKMMSTTVGETAADALNVDFHLGLTGTTVVTAALLAMTLVLQLRARRYVPWLYWLVVLLVSVFGTLVTDNLNDRLGVPMAVSTAVFGMALIATLFAWFVNEGTLAIDSVDTRRRELFYWVAILLTFALGTAAGDWIAEGLHLGYGYSALMFAGLIALVAVARWGLGANPIFTFWVAYILTRPLGASVGDLLSQPADNGGLGLGTLGTSAVFLTIIVAVVAYFTWGRGRSASTTA